MPSLFGKSTLDPAGTARTRGWNVLFFCASVTRRAAREGAASIGSAYTTAVAGATPSRATVRTTPVTGPAPAVVTNTWDISHENTKTRNECTYDLFHAYVGHGFS